ncbi:MAG: T9SS type A sorting domain-containing protein, partial [Bacteroidales bacterium]|nr:T9SS type A sorting domain-containing protein [Bacteroidales bacterium]
PNPVNAGEPIFISHSNGLGNYTVSIVDLNGRIIQTTNSSRNKLSIEAPQNPGLYLIQIEKQAVKLVSKLLVR